MLMTSQRTKFSPSTLWCIHDVFPAMGDPDNNPISFEKIIKNVGVGVMDTIKNMQMMILVVYRKLSRWIQQNKRSCWICYSNGDVQPENFVGSCLTNSNPP